MEVSFWKWCDFHSLYWGGRSPLSQHFWMEVQVIHSFIYSPTLGGLRQQWRKMWCLSLHTLRKINNRQILMQTINCDSDQCYKEAVKDVMGVLNRKAWSLLEVSRRPSWGNDFWDGKDKMNRTTKRKKPNAEFSRGKEPKIPSSNVQSTFLSENWAWGGKGICPPKLAQPFSPRARDANPAWVS